MAARECIWCGVFAAKFFEEVYCEDSGGGFCRCFLAVLNGLRNRISKLFVDENEGFLKAANAVGDC